VDEELVVLNPDALQCIRVIGSDVNPLGAFRFHAWDPWIYDCGLAFEPFEDLLLVADGRNGAVHLINVFEGTHAGFVATPIMCREAVNGVAVKQTSDRTCVAVLVLYGCYLLLTHTRGGPWEPMTYVSTSDWSHELCIACVQFVGPGLSFVSAQDDFDPGGQLNLYIHTSEPEDAVKFTHTKVFPVDTSLVLPGYSRTGLRTRLRMVALSARTLLVASEVGFIGSGMETQPLRILHVDVDDDKHNIRKSGTWLEMCTSSDVDGVPWAWTLAADGALLANVGSGNLSKFVPAMSQLRLAWMSVVMRAATGGDLLALCIW
jgi:hypothetical protein